MGYDLETNISGKNGKVVMLEIYELTMANVSADSRDACGWKKSDAPLN